jgi:NAD(P)H-dependent FMN reductase
MSQPHVVALSGSLSDESSTRAALRVVLEAAADEGATTDFVDLRHLDLPTFDPDDRTRGDADELHERVDAADAVILGTPNYHGSYSGALKNALDYLGRDEFEGTTVGLLVVAGGSFPTPALEHLRTVVRTIGGWTLPHQVAVPRTYETVSGGELVADDYRERAAELGREAVRYAGVDDYPEVAEEASRREPEPGVTAD